MGLTIHYSLRSTTRSPTKVRDLVRRLRSRALDLPFERIDEIVEFKGTECDFQARDQDDPHRWLLIQSRQLVSDPRDEDCRYTVSPQHVIAFSTWPGHTDVKKPTSACPAIRRPSRSAAGCSGRSAPILVRGAGAVSARPNTPAIRTAAGCPTSSVATWP